MSTLTIPTGEYYRLSNVDWAGYLSLYDHYLGRHVRLTYDRGELEFMTLGSEHERCKTFLGRLVESLTEVLDIDIACGGSMTFKGETLRRGFEPDECYWIQNEPIMRGRMDYDPDTDPPPDLGIEVEVTRSALNRLGIYAAFRVPELWRLKDQKVRFFRLEEDGSYKQTLRSVAFPFLTSDDLNPFLARFGTLSATKLIRSFREWVRETIVHPPETGLTEATS